MNDVDQESIDRFLHVYEKNEFNLVVEEDPERRSFLENWFNEIADPVMEKLKKEGKV